MSLRKILIRATVAASALAGPMPAFAANILVPAAPAIAPPAMIVAPGISSGGVAGRFDQIVLNPQPLPPNPCVGGKCGRSRLSGPQGNPGDEVSLNPQPLPPKARARTSRGDAVSLNPQPLPPREIGTMPR